MPALYWLSVTLHVLAAMVWLGGLFFLGLVGAPVLRTLEPTLRRTIFDTLGTRFRAVGWTALGLLVVTGVANLRFRGLLQWDGVLGSGAFWTSPLGKALAVKLGAVVFIVVVGAYHDFFLGPASSRAEVGSREAARYRRLASISGRITALAGLILVIAAVRVARGG